MRYRKHLLAGVAAVSATTGGMLCADEPNCLMRQITPYWQGQPGELGDMLGVISSTTDGRFVALSSYSTYFIDDADQMHGHIRQIVVLDRETQWGELISVAHKPAPGETISGNTHASWYSHISANGRYVAWGSNATNHVEQEVTGEHIQVYVRDRQEGVTYLASVSSEGEIANDWSSYVRVGVSNYGQVVFASRATNLVPDQSTSMWQVYMHDVHTGVTELVSRDVNGSPSYLDASHPAISADGKVISFMTRAHLVPGLNFDTWNIFVRDLNLGTTEVISVDANGLDRMGWGDFSFVSDDGNSVAFRFGAINGLLDPTMPPEYIDAIYARNRSASTTTGINRTWENGPAVISPEIGFAISGDGKYVSWESIDQATPIDVNPIWHIYRTNVETLEIDLVTVDANCDPIPEMHDQMWHAISGDGRHVTFISLWNVMLDPDFDWIHHLYQWSDPSAEPGIPGDIDGDGCVDQQDLALLLSAYGSVPGDSNWNPDADVSGDGEVGHADLAILLAHYGEGC